MQQYLIRLFILSFILSFIHSRTILVHRSFIHNNPNVGCSIGLMYNRHPIVGVIAMPFWPSQHQLFTARQGEGAWVSDLKEEKKERLPLGGKAARLESLKECLIVLNSECGNIGRRVSGN